MLVAVRVAELVGDGVSVRVAVAVGDGVGVRQPRMAKVISEVLTWPSTPAISRWASLPAWRKQPRVSTSARRQRKVSTEVPAGRSPSGKR